MTDHPLNLMADPWPTTIDEGVADAERIVLAAVAEHGPIEASFLLVSGGNDSMVLWDVCERFADKVVHVNTGIGVPQTNEFVRRIADERGSEFIEEHPPIPYDELVLGRWQGFPGPAGHRFAYQRLKERCIEQVLRDHRTKRGQRFLLLTGVRAAESARRMGYASPVDRRKGQVWANPLMRWSNELMAEYRRTRDLPVNEVTANLHMSGECLCGAFAKPGELDHLAFWYPEVAERIRDLERRAEAAGLAACRWGVRPPKKGQTHATGKPNSTAAAEFVAAADAALAGDMAGPLCSSCTVPHDDEAHEQIVRVTSSGDS